MSKHEELVAALREVLAPGDDDAAPLLIKRIPFICTDILWIKKLIWALLVGNGFVLLALIGVAIQRAFA